MHSTPSQMAEIESPQARLAFVLPEAYENTKNRNGENREKEKTGTERERSGLRNWHWMSKGSQTQREGRGVSVQCLDAVSFDCLVKYLSFLPETHAHILEWCFARLKLNHRCWFHQYRGSLGVRSCVLWSPTEAWLLMLALFLLGPSWCWEGIGPCFYFSLQMLFPASLSPSRFWCKAMSLFYR